MSFRVPEKFRQKTGYGSTDERAGCNGVFIIPAAAYKGAFSHYIKCTVTDGEHWEHVAVEVLDKRKKAVKRVPAWPELKGLRSVFWEPGDVVVQFHAPGCYDANPYRLHLWRHKDEFVTPPPVAQKAKQ